MAMTKWWVNTPPCKVSEVPAPRHGEVIIGGYGDPPRKTRRIEPGRIEIRAISPPIEARVSIEDAKAAGEQDVEQQRV